MDENMSQEMIGKLADEQLAKYKTENLTRRGASTEWYFTVETFTGYQTDNATNGKKMAQVRFRTDKGDVISQWLDISAGHSGTSISWFRTYFPREAVAWVQIQTAEFALRGTDDWFLRSFKVSADRLHQNVHASGKADLNKSIDKWFYNDSPSAWDRFKTGYGSGTMYFTN